jgi:hypothetical protein
MSTDKTGLVGPGSWGRSVSLPADGICQRSADRFSGEGNGVWDGIVHRPGCRGVIVPGGASETRRSDDDVAWPTVGWVF